MKKTVLIISAILTMLFTNCAFAENAHTELELLKKLGITDDVQISEDTVTRGDFAESIMRFMAIDNVADVYDASFADVTEYTIGYENIYYLKSRNILSGAGDGKFYPDAPITRKQAAIVLARVLGYGAVAGDIEYHAASLALTSMTDEPLTQGELVNVFYKALDCDCVALSHDGTGGFELKENYLSQTFGVYKGKGIVNANSQTLIDGNGTVTEDTVIIGKHKLNYAGDGIDDLLGMEVEYYYESDDEDTLILFIPTSRNKVTVISSHDIISFDGSVIKYYENNKTKTLKVKAQADVIYNGIACPDFGAEKLNPDNGRIVYIENGTDVDCIKVEEYKNRIVSAVYDGKIYLESDDTIDLSKFDDDKLFIYDAEGNPSEEIPVNAVLSMYYSDKKDVLKAVYSTNVLESVKVEALDENVLTVGGVQYFVNKSYTNAEAVLKDRANVIYKIYLDALGEVAKIEKAAGSTTFGYIISVNENHDNEELYIKILVEDGEIENIECATMVSVDGEKKAYTKSGLEAKLKGQGNLQQLVTFKVNPEGKINFIDTAADSVSADDFRVAYKVESSVQYKTATKMLGVDCPLDELTKVFFVNTNPQGKNRDNYWTGGISSLANDDEISNAAGYKTTSEFGSAEAVVIYDAATAAGKIKNGTTRLSVVKGLSTVVNEDGDERVRVTFITGGKLVAYNLCDTISAEEAAALSEGDLVRFAIDRNYEVSDIDIVCNLRDGESAGLLYGAANGFSSTTGAIGGATYRIISGSVYDYKDGLICVSRGNFNEIDPALPNFEYFRGVNGAFICVVENDNVRAGTEADIIKYLDAPGEHSRIFIATRYTEIRDIVIYNNDFKYEEQN